MSTQSEALRPGSALWLAQVLDAYSTAPHHKEAAAELRRLHAENERLKTVPMKYRRMEFNAQLQAENERLIAQRDALLEALREIGAYTGEGPTYTTPWQDIVCSLGERARAAIKAVEETK